MYIFLILALIIAILAVIFAVQNVAVVTIAFFSWNIQTSLAVALLVALGAGVLITLLLSIPRLIKGKWNSVTRKKAFSSLESERDSLKQKFESMTAERDQVQQKLVASEKEIANLEEQLASISASLQDNTESSANALQGPPLVTNTPDTPPESVGDKPAI